MNTVWRIAARWNDARYRRSLKLADLFKARAEKFYALIKGRGE